MAPPVKRADNEKKLDALLSFAKHLEEVLENGHTPPSLNAQLSKEIERIGSLHIAVAASKKVDLDKQGTRLWNLASKLRKEKSKQPELVCPVRVFACLLLDCAGRCMHGSVTNDIRILKTALKTSKYCLEERQLAFAETIIERVAFYNERLRDISPNHRAIAKSLAIQYLTIRVALAWRQDRLDLAKIMLVKLDPTENDFDTSQAEELSEILFEIGRDLIRRIQWADASYWLDAAYNVLAARNPESLSNDAGQLRVSIVQSMVKSLIHQEGEDNLKKSWNIVRELSIQHGDKLLVLLLKLDLLGSAATPPAEDYRDTLQKITQTVPLTDTNVSTIIHHVHKLRGWDPGMAHIVLVSFLADRLLGGGHEAWLEKTLIIIIWNCATTTDFPDVEARLVSVFNDIAACSSKTLRPAATHAAQILLWKRIESTYNQEQFEAAESWCRLSLHDIFRSSGSMNVGKLQRKLILCALGLSNATKAREIASSMSTANQDDPSTQYLLYKVALRCQDTEMAGQCLNAICASSTKDGTLLYACVLEAQRVGDQAEIIIALQRVLEQFNYSAPSGVHLPALLRCTARLLMRSIDTASNIDIDSLCKVFEGAEMQAKRSRRSDKESLFTLSELDWFSRNCYNLSLKVCRSWPQHQTLRLIHTALKLIELHPTDLDPAISADLSLRRCFCDFVVCCLEIYTARHEDNIELQLQHYLAARKAVSDWRSHQPAQLARLEGGARADLKSKHTSLLAWDFEAAARLKAWGSLDGIIAECAACEDMDVGVFAILADIVLASEAPAAETKIPSLQQIINVTWRVEGSDIEKLSRWIRCLVSLALTSDGNTVTGLLDQVVAIVEDSATTGGLGEGRRYPAEELEWLATTTYNRAIDFYCSSQDAECRRWVEKALMLAGICEDSGALHRVLQEKFGQLVWDGR